MRASYGAKEEVSDGLKELNCHRKRKKILKTTVDGQIVKKAGQGRWLREDHV